MTISAAEYRHTLGHYPTGVCVITSTHHSHGPVGLVVGSFSSVSLEPPMVGFFPAVSSTSWPRIEATGRFVVNVLSRNQEGLCQRFAAKGGDKFAGLSYQLNERGLPVLDGVVAWIDCTLHAVHEAGDHVLVLGGVNALRIESSAQPLIFCRGKYGQFAP